MNNKIPPPIVTLVFGLLIYFTRNYFPSYENISFVLNVLSIVLLIAGFTITGTAIVAFKNHKTTVCLLYTSPSPRDQRGSRMPSSA